jgi:molybdopterin/thiamine biosynthesis adenylyltransferase
MSGARSAEGATPAGSWREQWRETFRLELRAAAFTRTDTDQGVERWKGDITVAWADLEDGRHRRATHTIAIELPPGFPFRRPTVRRVDSEMLPGREHVIREGGASALCLWVDGAHGWRPWSTFEDVLGRVHEWFGHRYRDDWDSTDQPPDIHAYFATSEDATFMLTGNDWPPPAEARQGRFGIWKRNNSATFAGGPTSSLTTPPPDTLPLRERFSLTRSGEQLPGIGLWYRLTGPPAPVTNLSRLFTMLDLWRGLEPGVTQRELRAIIADRVRPGEERLYFALGYPDHTAQEHWLFLYANLSSHRRNWQSPAALDEISVYGLEAAPATTEAIMRRTGHTAAVLHGRRVVVFGAGALGGRVALWLATAGVPALDIVDSDRLRPGNVIRHVAGLSVVGREKSWAVYAEIWDRAPDCDVQTHPETWDEAKLNALIGAADVVVDATAVPAFTLYLNELSVAAGRPFVSAAAFRRAHLGRVRITRPGRDACALCYEGSYVPNDVAYPVILQGDEGAFVESGCGVATVEATALDIDVTANVAARAVLHLLREQHAGGLPEHSQNHAIIVNEIVDDLAATPHADILATPGIHWSTWARRPGCDACGAVADAKAESSGASNNANGEKPQ